MSETRRPRYDPNSPPASPETQLRWLLAASAIVLFLVAAWIFLNGGDAARGLMWLSIGLAAMTGCLVIPQVPAK